MNKVHLVGGRPAPKELRTLCGMFGFDEGGGEFTLLGRETRHEYAQNDISKPTCKRCVAAAEKFARRR